MTPRRLRANHTFPADGRSVAEARRYARETLGQWDVDAVVDDAILLVSELVTNAFTHAGTPATLELVLDEGGLRVVVEDLHPGRGLPMAAAAPPDDAEFGRGLLITAMIASTWGVEYRSASKRVWARLPLAGVTTAADSEGWAETAEGTSTTTTPRSRAVLAPEAAVDPLGLGSQVLARLGLDDLVTLVTEQVRDRLGADASYLLLAEDLDDELRVRAVSGLPDALRGRAVGPRAAGSPQGWAPISLRDLARTRVPILAGTDLESVVVAPVAFEGRVVGALAVGSERVDGFSEQQSVLLQRCADWIAGTVDRARLRQAELQGRGWLSFLAESGALLAGSLDLEKTVAMTGQLVVPQLARWCGIYLADDRERPVLVQAWHEDESQTGSLRAALSDTLPDGPSPSDPRRDGSEPAGAVLSIPLEARGRTIGWLALGRDTGDPLRGEVLLVAESIARRSALAIDNARAHADLRAAGQTLQRSLLPASLPAMPGAEVGVVYEPAGEGDVAGGDFYDLFPIAGGRWCFMVGDVCGTGAEAAAITGLARHTVGALVRAGFPVATTLERLNDALLEEGDRARFVTMVCGTLEPVRGGALLMRLVCAGHPPPFVVGAGTGDVRQVGRPQLLLGVVEGESYAAEEMVLERGDLIVALTDGVLERRRGQRMLGEDGVAAVLRATRDLPAQAVAERLRRAVVEFSTEPQRDDMAILSLRAGASLGYRAASQSA